MITSTETAAAISGAARAAICPDPAEAVTAALAVLRNTHGATADGFRIAISRPATVGATVRCSITSPSGQQTTAERIVTK